MTHYGVNHFNFFYTLLYCFKSNLNNHEKQNHVLCMCVNIIDRRMYCTHSPLQCSHGYHGEYVCYGVEPKQQLLHLEPKIPKICEELE